MTVVNQTSEARRISSGDCDIGRLYGFQQVFKNARAEFTGNSGEDKCRCLLCYYAAVSILVLYTYHLS